MEALLTTRIMFILFPTYYFFAVVSFGSCIFRRRSQVQLGHVLLTSVVDAKSAREGRLAVYVGHLPEFESIAKDISSKPLGRQLALVGQDLITHTRVVLSCRSKRLYFEPLEENDVWAGQVV